MFRAYLAQVFPDEKETEECKNGAPKEDVHVLCAANRHVRLINPVGHDATLPSPFNPVDHIPAQPECIGRVKEPPLRALQHVSLIHEVVKHSATLREEFIEACIGVLKRGMFL